MFDTNINFNRVRLKFIIILVMTIGYIGLYIGKEKHVAVLTKVYDTRLKAKYHLAMIIADNYHLGYEIMQAADDYYNQYDDDGLNVILDSCSNQIYQTEPEEMGSWQIEQVEIESTTIQRGLSIKRAESDP